MVKADLAADSARRSRLITQNLLTSASQFEIHDGVDEISLQDLVAYIDLFCLYDHAVTLGRPFWNRADFRSDFFELLKQESFVDELPLDDKQRERILDSVGGHLAVYLGADIATDQYKNLLPHVLSDPHGDRHWVHLMDSADRPEELAVARAWLATTPGREIQLQRLYEERRGFHRAVLFLYRTYLYFGCADVLKMDFTPDRARYPALVDPVQHEVQLASRLLEAVRRARPTEAYPAEYQRLRERVSPFAAVLFRRAKNKHRIVPELQQLRNELKGVRANLARLENAVLDAESGGEEAAALARASEYLDSIAKEMTPGGGGAYRVSALPLLSLTLGTASAIGTQLVTQPGQRWEDAVANAAVPALMSQIPQFIAMLRHRSRVDIRAASRLAADAPSSRQLAQDVKHLFEVDFSNTLAGQASRP